MKGNPAGSGGSLTSRPTWSNTFEVFDHAGFFSSTTCHAQRGSTSGFSPSARARDHNHEQGV